MANNPVISRFLTATSWASPEETLTAPITTSDPEAYDFLTILKTYAEHQTLATQQDYFSLSKWDGGHDEYHHDGTTCVTLEYKADSAAKVRSMLPHLGFAAYEIETRNGRANTVLFAFPVSEPLDHLETTRAASLIAEALECTGLKNHSFLYTYFFRFRPSGTVAFHEGALVSRKFLAAANDAKLFVEIKRWMR
jgi:hypothetical protein